jgi:hypothetical protein
LTSNLGPRSRPQGLRWVWLAVPLFAFALGGCAAKDLFTGRSRLEVSHEAHSQEKSIVKVREVALGPGGGEHSSVFQLTLRNSRNQPLWVHARIQSPRLSQSCEGIHPLDPLADAQIQCPQGLEADGTFALDLKVFDDIGNTHLVERAQLKVSFGADGAAQIEWE